MFVEFWPVNIFHHILSNSSGRVAANTLLASLPRWGPGYHVAFQFYVHSSVPGDQYGYSWIFGISGLQFFWQKMRLQRCLLVCWLDPTIPLGHPKDYGQPAIWYNSAKYNNRTNVAAFFKLNEKSDFGYYGNGHENEIELQRWYSYSVSSLRQNGKVSRVLILCSNWIYVSSRYF